MMSSIITELHMPGRGWRYHSGSSLYTERFQDGRLIAASLQDTGVPWCTRDEETDQPAFELQVDGESLSFGWELVESSVTPADSLEAVPESRLLLLFMVAAGWYADIHATWPDTSGDWVTGTPLPNDLFPVYAYARSKGLR